MASAFFRRLVLLALLISLLVSSPVVMAADLNASSDRRIADFSLPTTDGNTIAFSRDPSVQFTVLCFLGTECPLAKVYGPRLQRMSAKYFDRGVQFIGINSNVQDSMEDLSVYVREHGVEFPVAKDYDRTVALNAGATRTPEVMVVDRTGAIRYQGRIDDQYQPGVSRSVATQHDLSDAIEQLLAGQAVARPRTTAVGCLIAFPRETNGKSDITFCKQIIRVLQRNCTECHREGEIGPFALEDYDEVIGWADMSLEVIEQGRMPPWHANPNFGSFANSRHMLDEDKVMLQRWVDAGMPFGEAKDLPPKKEYVQGWRLPREPDMVIEMSDKPFQIPAEGTVEYQYFVINPGFTEDKWIRAVQVIPGNASVVHHCIAFTRPPDGSDFRDIGLLSAYVPGQVRGLLPEGFAQKVIAGSRIVFQMHYTPTGKPEQDNTRLGLVFAKPEEVTHEVYVLGGIEQEFEIPPGAPHHVVDGRIHSFPRDGFLLSVMPHMHLRGKAFSFQCVSKSKTETILEVPAYDFNWQHNYEFTSPLPLGEIEQLNFSATFDNSNNNPFNPDPNEFVTWGDQTWQEMAVTFITVARPLASTSRLESTSAEDAVRTQQKQKIAAQWKAERDAKATKFADRYIERFDTNGDRHLTRHELPHSVRMFGFWSFDHDNDQRLSHEEIKAEASSRFENKNTGR